MSVKVCPCELVALAEDISVKSISLSHESAVKPSKSSIIEYRLLQLSEFVFSFNSAQVPSNKIESPLPKICISRLSSGGLLWTLSLMTTFVFFFRPAPAQSLALCMSYPLVVSALLFSHTHL